VSKRLILEVTAQYATCVQGDSVRNVNILGGDSVGNCEKKGSYEHVSNSEWLPQ
jgi:hypothetical protein